MKKRPEIAYGFNPDYMKSVSKDDFIKAHQHLSEIVDLPSIWEEHNGTEKLSSQNKELKEKPKSI